MSAAVVFGSLVPLDQLRVSKHGISFLMEEASFPTHGTHCLFFSFLFISSFLRSPLLVLQFILSCHFITINLSVPFFISSSCPYQSLLAIYPSSSSYISQFHNFFSMLHTAPSSPFVYSSYPHTSVILNLISFASFYFIAPSLHSPFVLSLKHIPCSVIPTPFLFTSSVRMMALCMT